MLKSIALIFLTFIIINANAQKKRGVYATLGLNRIGVLYEFGTYFQLNKHQFIAGARFYGPDLVFEKKYPGLNLGYDYAFRNEHKMKILLGVNVSAFYENKASTNLWLFDPKLRTGAQWDIKQHYRLNLMAGFGTVINRVETSYTSNIETYRYLNYELALGFIYYFGINNRD